MKFDGPRRYFQDARDLLARVAFRDQLKNFALTSGKRPGPSNPRLIWRVGQQGTDHFLGHQRSNIGEAANYLVHCSDQFRRGTLLQ